MNENHKNFQIYFFANKEKSDYPNVFDFSEKKIRVWIKKHEKNTEIKEKIEMVLKEYLLGNIAVGWPTGNLAIVNLQKLTD